MGNQEQLRFHEIISSRYRECRLGNFNPPDTSAKSAVNELRKFCEQFESHFPCGLFIYGPIGTGKDHLMASVLRAAVVNYGKTAKWISGTVLYDQAKLDIRDDNSSIIATCSKPDILVISDPVPPDGRLTEFEVRTLHRLVDKRYCDSRPTWVTINVDGRDEAKSRLTSQIYSRLIDNSLRIACNWPSYRDSRKVTV